MTLKTKFKYALAITGFLAVAQIPLFIGIAKKEVTLGQGFKIDDICEPKTAKEVASIGLRDRFFMEDTIDLMPNPEPFKIMEDIIPAIKFKSIEKPRIKHSEAYHRRIAQAKELLGKHYQKSIVRKGESVPGISDFVKKQVKQLTVAKWKNSHYKISAAIMRASKKHSFDPMFLMAVIQNESTFDPSIHGSFGEIGLMQIKPSTADWISKKAGIRYKSGADLENPVKNIEIGAAYLAYLRTRFNSHSRLYLSAYNMGTTNVNRALGKQIWPKDYASRVMGFYVKYYTELASPAPQLVSQN